ncbi:copper resistance CopC family protein [Planosporangium sp. 12N6]|uniref:copper resistance CopC family protein n=1 Tax=Planosporangium spinosum TaxID=3402278 RepID=UPI003CEDC999
MRRLLILLPLIAVLVAVPAPASAHSALVSASPGPGDKVAPGVRVMGLTFAPLRGVGPHRVSVSGPDDKPVATGEPLLVDRTTLCFSVAQLQRPGVYAVSYSTVSDDGDPQQSRFYFQVVPDGHPVADPAGCQGRPLPPPTTAGTAAAQAPRRAVGTPILAAILGTGLAIKAGITIALIRAMRRNRRRSAGTPSGSGTA